MKTKSTLLLISLACMCPGYGAPVLLGGFHGENETAQQSPSISNISVILARTGASTDITQGFSQVSTSAGWGTQALDVAPADSNSPANHAIFQSGTTTPITLVLTITNNGTADLLLDSIHWIVKKDIANVGPPSGTLTYTSGSLSDTDNTGTTFAIANGTVGIDISLGSFLSDTTLANGESAVFTWAHDAPQDALGNTALRIDNFAISGAVDTGDVTPPSPSPMTWANVPAPVGEGSITMTATTATDDSEVQYEFTRYASDGVSVLFTSPWQSSAEFTDTGLDPATEYKYTVRARDLSANSNTTDPSTPAASVTTDPADTTPPDPSPITFLVAPVAVSPTSISMTATTATDSSGVEYRFIETSGHTGGTNSNWQDSPTYIDLGLSPNTEYSYTVQARDKSIAQNLTSEPLETASATTLPSGGIGTILLGGYHGGNESPSALQSGSISDVEVTLTSSTGDITNGSSQMASTLWGNSALDVASPGTSGDSVLFTSSTETRTLTLTITNDGTEELSLDGLHFLTKKDFADQGPQEMIIAYTSGDLGSPASTIVGYPNGSNNGFDVPLASFLGDTTLGAGESATFTWTSGLAQNPGGSTGFRVDNFAISGSSSGTSDYDIWGAAQSWTFGDPNTAAAEDYDGDGLTNDEERIFGLNPASGASVNPISVPLDPTASTFSYTRRTQALTGLTYTVWYSTDLDQWFEDTGATEGTISTIGNVETVPITLGISPPAGGKLFVRVRAQ